MQAKFVKTALYESKKTVSDEDIEEFIENLAQDKGGAFEMYLDFEQKKKLYKLIKSGKKIKVVIYDPEDWEKEDDDPHDTFDRFENKRLDLLKKSGWKVWREEENIQFTEYILIK